MPYKSKNAKNYFLDPSRLLFYFNNQAQTQRCSFNYHIQPRHATNTDNDQLELGNVVAFCSGKEFND